MKNTFVFMSQVILRLNSWDRLCLISSDWDLGNYGWLCHYYFVLCMPRNVGDVLGLAISKSLRWLVCPCSIPQVGNLPAFCFVFSLYVLSFEEDYVLRLEISDIFRWLCYYYVFLCHLTLMLEQIVCPYNFSDFLVDNSFPEEKEDRFFKLTFRI